MNADEIEKLIQQINNDIDQINNSYLLHQHATTLNGHCLEFKNDVEFFINNSKSNSSIAIDFIAKCINCKLIHRIYNIENIMVNNLNSQLERLCNKNYTEFIKDIVFEFEIKYSCNEQIIKNII